mgnify:FL=1
MGWHQEPDVLKNINLTNKQARKSRYGLMGPDPYTDDPHNGVGNVYYGVVETEKFGVQQIKMEKMLPLNL